MSAEIKDISLALRQAMLACPNITNLVINRISSPAFNNEDENPKICYRQNGGDLTYHRYAFRVRGDTIQQAKEVAMTIVNLFSAKAPELIGFNSVFGILDGNINEVYYDDEKANEVFFNIRFEFLES